MYFLWMAESAFVVGLILLIVPRLGWEIQLIFFSVLAVASILVARRYLQRHPIATDQPLLNRRAVRYVGRVFRLEAPIVNGEGRIRVDDTFWRVEGPDCAAGEKVRVVAADGVILKVSRAD